MNYIEQLGEKALEAKRKIATASTGEKNKVLEAIAQVLLENSDAILAENEKDIANARDNGISETMVDRLRLTKERIKGIADAWHGACQSRRSGWRSAAGICSSKRNADHKSTCTNGSDRNIYEPDQMLQ